MWLILKSIPKFIGVAVALINAWLVVLIKNRVTFPTLLEAMYFDRLSDADPQVFNEDYFVDIATLAREKVAEQAKVTWWYWTSFALLLLCVFGIIDNVVFYGTAVDIRKYSSLILLIFSTSRLRYVAIQIARAEPEAILRAHARHYAGGSNSDIYYIRYKNIATYKRVVALNGYKYKGQSIGVISGRRINSLKLLVRYVPILAASFVLLQHLFFFIISIYILFIPGLGLPIRVIIVLLSIGIEATATLIPAFAMFAVAKDPNAEKAFWREVKNAYNAALAKTRTGKGD